MRTLLSFCFSFLLLSSTGAQSYKDTVFTNYFKRDAPGWVASDGSLSLPLPDGRTLWLMGDSHVDQALDENGEIPCLFNTRNCVLVQDAEDRSKISTFYDETGGDLYERQFVKMPGDDRATYWPASGTVLGDTAYTFWTRYAFDTDEVWNLRLTGTVIAKIKLPEIELVDVTPIQYSEVEYGQSIVWDEENEYYYIYGKHLDWIVFKPILARCRRDQLLGNWEFYLGDGQWGSEPSNVAIAPEVSAEYSVFKLNGRHHMFYQQNGYLQCGEGREMFIYSSEDPWGPFSDSVKVYTMNDQFEGAFPKTYNAQAHPQFIENDELLISYNINKLCPSVCQNDPFGDRYDPNLYRPQFARVPLSLFLVTDNSEPSEMRLRVAPNPSHGIFQLLGSDKAHYQVWNSAGQLARSGQGPEIDLSDQLNGFYIARILTPHGQTAQFRLVKY